jgi:hypothetical protein
LPTDVEHGREIPRDPGCARFGRGNFRGTTYQVAIKCGSQAEVVRENRRALRVVGAVHCINAVQDWYAETRFFGCDILNLSDQSMPASERQSAIVHVQDGPDMTADNGCAQFDDIDACAVARLRSTCEQRIERKLRHLPDLFFDRHPRQ